ncbi:MAG: SGNH/GDSL hydrolase family protein [Myxococcota bacterium]
MSERPLRRVRTRRSGRRFRGRRLLSVVAVALVSLAVAGAAAEAGLRVLGRYPPPPYPPQPRRPDLFRPDARFGYKLWPSTDTRDRYPPDGPRVLELRSNGQGLRSARELEAPDPRPRLWVLGDSFVFGAGVEAEERLTEDLERLEPGWRVDNLGLPGFGIDLMLRALEALAPRVRPSVVLLAIYTDDFRRALPQYSGMGYAVPKFELVRGRLVSVPYPALSGWRRLRLVQAAYEIYWRPRRNRFPLHAALLRRFLEQSRELGFRGAVAFLPGRDDTLEDRERRRFLRQQCAKLGLPFRDLSDAMHQAGVDRLYLPHNPHWNARGHALAAELLRPFLAPFLEASASTREATPGVSRAPGARSGRRSPTSSP